MLFPLPLSDIEQFMVQDHYPGYPNNMFTRVRLSGQLDREIFEESFRQTFDRHLLVQAKLNRRRGKYFWTPADTPYVVHPIKQRKDIDNFPNMPAYDVNSSGGEVHLIEDEHSTDVIFQIHHGSVDGLGGMQVVRDWMLIYSQLHAQSHAQTNKPPKLQRLDNESLLTRNDFGFKTWAYWKKFHEQLIGLAGVYEFLFKRPIELVPNSVSDIDAPPPVPYPRSIGHEFSIEESKRHAAAAVESEATTNELLVRDLFLAINQWRTKHKFRRDSDRMRILIPFNMREFKHRRLPACNRVSFIGMDRKASDCRHPKKMLWMIRGQMNVIHKLNLGLVFPTMLRIISAFPGGLRRMTSPNRCAATCLLTNIGEPYERVKLPRVDGKLQIGNLVMEGVDLLPALRPKTNAAFTVFRYAKKLCVTMNYDPRALSKADADEFLRMYVRRIERTIGSTAVSKVAE